MSPFGSAISSDGKFVLYHIDNLPLHGHTIVIQSAVGSWKKEFVNVDQTVPAFFSSDSKKCIFCRNDTFFVQDLGSDKLTFVSKVSDLKTPQKTGNWLAYTLKESPIDSLVLLNIISGKSFYFSNVRQYTFDRNGSQLVFTTMLNEQGKMIERLQLFDLRTSATTIIHSDISQDSANISSDYSFDNDGAQMAFVIRGKLDGQNANEIWYFKLGMPVAERRVYDSAPGMDCRYTIAGSPVFSKSGKWLFFDLNRQPDSMRSKNVDRRVHIWKYNDVMVDPDRRVYAARGSSFKAVEASTGGRVALIETENEDVKFDPSQVTGDYIVTGPNSYNAKYWWPYPKPAYHLINLQSGLRQNLPGLTSGFGGNAFYPSPDGKKLVYYDANRNNFYCYDIQTHIEHNLTNDTHLRCNNDRSNTRTLNVARESVGGVAAWSNNDSSLFIYDTYDIWQLDLFGNKRPVNFTNYFGRRNHIELRMLNGPENPYNIKPASLEGGDKLLLVGFNTISKKNGFLIKEADKASDPQILTMGSFTYYMQENQKPHGFAISNGFQPIKAKDAEMWLVMRQSIADAPNYYTTSDFRSYFPITDLQPEKQYEWITDTLLTWKLPEGSTCQGILYKPQKMSPNVKYPVIINYYEKLSHTLNQFPYPGYTGADINVAWFVANGYLVFVSDISYKKGITAGKAAFVSVTSAVDELSKFPYVDPKRIGLQGHSFGAYETNYIISHTRRFAAAAEFAGVTDEASAYLTLVPFISNEEHSETELLTETGHSNFGATLWERPDLYLDNSAVWKADKIGTPLLITHNKSDNNIQWRQGVELYMAMRRLNKRVWMLEYLNSGHNVQGADAVDYTMRLTDFFDHFLKQKAIPEWMK